VHGLGTRISKVLKQLQGATAHAGWVQPNADTGPAKAKAVLRAARPTMPQAKNKKYLQVGTATTCKHQLAFTYSSVPDMRMYDSTLADMQPATC
jgi:hypothetical protein